MQKTGSFPVWEDPLAKGMATHSSILAWEIPWTEEPGGLQSMGSKSQDTTKRLTLNTSLHFIPDTSFPARGRLIPFPSPQIWIGLGKLLLTNKMQWK